MLDDILAFVIWVKLGVQIDYQLPTPCRCDSQSRVSDFILWEVFPGEIAGWYGKSHDDTVKMSEKSGRGFSFSNKILDSQQETKMEQNTQVIGSLIKLHIW